MITRSHFYIELSDDDCKFITEYVKNNNIRSTCGKLLSINLAVTNIVRSWIESETNANGIRK